MMIMGIYAIALSPVFLINVSVSFIPFYYMSMMLLILVVLFRCFSQFTQHMSLHFLQPEGLQGCWRHSCKWWCLFLFNCAMCTNVLDNFWWHWTAELIIYCLPQLQQMLPFSTFLQLSIQSLSATEVLCKPWGLSLFLCNSNEPITKHHQLPGVQMVLFTMELPVLKAYHFFFAVYSKKERCPLHKNNP